MSNKDERKTLSQYYKYQPWKGKFQGNMQKSIKRTKREFEGVPKTSEIFRQYQYRTIFDFVRSREKNVSDENNMDLKSTVRNFL